MQAVILAGGKGTRLRPYTVTLPKPLVPVGDYPILEIIIRQLARSGFKRVTVSTGHLAELIEAYFGDGRRWSVEIDYVREAVPLNTAGALKLISGYEDDFIVINGDTLTNLDYGNFLQEHIGHKAAITIGTKVRESTIDFGVVETDAADFLMNYREKPTYTFPVSMGIYALSRCCVDLIEPGESLGMPDLFCRVLRAGKKIFCLRSECYWLDIGRVDDYEQAQQDFERHKQEFLKSDV